MDDQSPEAVLDGVADAYFYMDLDAARRLKKVKLPETGDEDCENEIGKFMLHVCEQFKIEEE